VLRQGIQRERRPDYRARERRNRDDRYEGDVNSDDVAH
jgi:hypothetical protein